MTDTETILNERDVRERLRHDDVLTVSDVVRVWEQVQAELRAGLDEIPSHHDCVHNGRDAVIYVDSAGWVLGDILDAVGVDDDVMRSHINDLMHDTARRLCDYNWSAVYPLVVAKDRGIMLGERHAEDRLADLASKGEGAAAALDYYMVEERGYSESRWAEMRGVSQQAVSETVNKIRDAT